MSKWDSTNNSGRGRVLLIIGNGPSVEKINVNNLIKTFSPIHTDLAFVNGFLYSPPFDILPYKRHFFIADPYLKVLLEWLLNNKDSTLIGSPLLVDILFGNAPKDVQDSMAFDAISISRAIEDKEVTFYAPHNFEKILRDHGVNNYFPISRFVISQKWPHWIRYIIFKLGIYGPNLINPLGPAVINYAIMMAIRNGYDKVYIVGHNDELNYHNYFIHNGVLAYKYRYYWEKKDRIYLRNDEWNDICEAQFNNIRSEKALRDSTRTKILYLSKSHMHLFLTDPSTPHIFD